MAIETPTPISAMVCKDGIFNVMDLEGPPRWPFALQAMQRVAIETPTQEASLEDVGRHQRW